MSGSELDTRIVWTRQSKVKPEPIVIGRRIKPDWLKNEVSTVQVHFAKPLHQALNDLLTASKNIKLYLPIVRLRAALMAGLDGVITLDRDLGVITRPGYPPTCVLEMYPPLDDIEPTRGRVQSFLKRWCLDVLEPWSAAHELDELATRVKKAALVDNVVLTPAKRSLISTNAAPTSINFHLAIREIGERLDGELLFTDERGPCSLIVSPDFVGNSIELMTPPKRGIATDYVFSMVARLSIVTTPYSPYCYLRVGTAKRVWASRMPGRKPSAPRKVTAYVTGPGRPVLPVSVLRTKEGWEFGDDYAAVRMESGNVLPATLAEAILQREPAQDNWWAGVPELTTLFDSVSPRTVFESDEIDLLETVTSLLTDVADLPIEFGLHKLPRRQGKSSVTMLKLSDVGVAGAGLEETDEEEHDIDTNEAEERDRPDKLAAHREQNIRALQIVHKQDKPTLWAFGGTPDEQELIRKSVEALFGDAITVKSEVLPGKTHGLRENLPEASASAKVRFDARVQAWKPAADELGRQKGPKFALICAADREGRKPEDAVNYFAGMHAMCSMAGANVHHVLPISGKDPERAKQNFIHRLQSALLDVLLAHSGIVFGVDEFLEKCYGNRPPKYIYGIQAVRSRARAFSGESDVTFIVITRLIVETGLTEVQFCYPVGSQNRRSEWFSLAEGLRWLGSQRQLFFGDEPWLKRTFKTFIRDTLNSVNQVDPRALVLIDWDNIAGLWPGIRDSDLTSSTTPKLDNADLAREFPEISLVRVRRNVDSLSLRGISRSTFDGWREGATREATGERLSEIYPTTSKSLVEIVAPDVENTKRYGHFISSMGYSKTAQVMRGFSCYRSMPRMKAITGASRGEARIFEKIMLEPANMDAPVPAPLEITVMSSPPDVAPADIAMAVMGLRLGYAHYNDWTALPAPLFFKRKIEDYVIRYPESEEFGEELEVSETADSVEAAVEADKEVAETETKLSQAVIETVLPSEVSAPELDNIQPDVAEGQAIEELQACMGEEDSLARAKRLEMPVLYSSDDADVPRLYQAMMWEDGARAKVRVDVPSFVTARALFGDLHLENRDCWRFWRATRRFGYVKQTSPQISADRLPGWMMKRLNRPQAAYSLDAAWIYLGGALLFKPIQDLLERYNQTADEPIKIDRTSLTDLGEVAKWAVAIQDDTAVAWLIFYAAQMPGYDCAKNIMDGIDLLPGPLSKEALDYYLDCADASSQAIKQKKNVGPNFQAISIKRAESHASTGVEVSSTGALAQEIVPQMPTPSDVLIQLRQGDNPIMNIKNDIVASLYKLEPGAEGFDDHMTAIRRGLSEIEGVHTARVAERARLMRERSEETRLLTKAEDLAQQIEAQRPDLTLGPVSVQASLSSQEGQTEKELDAIAGLLVAVVSQRERTHALAMNPLPQGASLIERRRRNEEENRAIDALTEAVRELERAVTDCQAFLVQESGATQPDLPEPLTEIVEDSDEGRERAPNPSKGETDVGRCQNTQDTGTPPQVLKATEPVKTEATSESTRELHSYEDATDASQEESEEDPYVDEASETIQFDLQARNVAFDTLFKLADQRRYALAITHVSAMGGLLPPSLFNSHQIVLDALFSTLDTIDCNFAIDANLAPRLKELLKENPPGHSDICDQLPLSVGILGAGVVSMLFDSPGSDTRWTVLDYLQARFSDTPGLSALTERIGKLDNLGILLTRDKFSTSRVGAITALAAELARVQEQARGWSKSTEVHSMWNHRGYIKIHEEMFSPQGQIGQCLALIVKGDAARLKQLYADAHKKFDKPSVTIDDLTKKVKERTRADGKPRQWLIENLQRTQALIERYLELVDKKNNPETALASNEQGYLAGLFDDLTNAISDIEALDVHKPVEGIYKQAALTVLKSVLCLFDDKHPPACVPDDLQLLLMQLPMGRNFKPSMKRAASQEAEATTLICSPEEVLSETKRLAEEPLELSNDNEESGLVPALISAARDHAASGRILPASAIDSKYPKAFSIGEQSLAARHQKARVALDSELHDARQQVAHAMALSALDSAEANRMLRVIEDIRAANAAKHSIGHLEGESVAYPDFPHARTALRQGVLDVLEAKLTDRKRSLARMVSDYEAEHGHDAGRDIARIREMLATNNASNLRTAYDAFALLQKEGRLPPAAIGGQSISELYEEFVKGLKRFSGTHKPFLETLVEKLEQQPDTSDPEWLKKLDASARKEAIEFIGHWHTLCKLRNPQEASQALAAFFNGIGVAKGLDCIPESVARSNRIQFYLPEKPFSSGSGDFFVPPNLGSRASHVVGYALGGRPQDQEIRQTIQEIGANPTFILVRGHLTLERRAKLSKGAQALIIDDDLVAYIALHPGERIRKLMEITLLTCYSNPYADYGSVPVPPEMFFGRQNELNKLRRVQSAAVLYGGRRLGKSSLLDQIEREAQAHQGDKAAYAQMDGARFAPDHVTYAWTTLYKALVARSIIAQMPQESSDWATIQSWIEKELTSGKGNTRACYLLIDEADALMGRELESPQGAPSFIRSLQHLCEAVQKQCHVRYVIAGLHNITRMSTEENSPLGKAESIALEPYSSADDIQRGIELVTKPLAALGFYFDKVNEDLPLRILSVCNFYPAFIQLYCNHLLERMYNIRQDKRPPIFVSTADLDAVERDGNLLSELQRKFELNLNLDKRYKAIALILADVYYAESESGQYNGLTTSQIREYCETYAAPHFAKTGPGVYEALVDEMRKLNVLERVGSRYVLRNPNIAMMMGDRERISHLIDELAREIPEQARSHGERRFFMEHANNKILFPMPASWVRTNVEFNDGELLILVGNNLSGLPDIANVQGDWMLGQHAIYSIKALNNPQAATHFIRRYQGTSGAKRLIAATPHSWKIQDILGYASVAMKSQKIARLALIALPDKAYELAMALGDGSLTNSRWNVVAVPPWTEDAVHFHLDENVTIAENSSACQALLSASCGFGAELAKLCNRQLSVEDANALPNLAQKTLAPDLPTFYQKIGMPDSVDATVRKKMESFLSLLDDNTEKKSVVVDEAMQIAGVTPGHLLFLTWMGLLQEGPGNTWVVPKLYRRLI